MVVINYGKRGAEISKGIYYTSQGLTKGKRCDIIQSVEETTQNECFEAGEGR